MLQRKPGSLRLLMNEHLGVFVFHFLVEIDSQKQKENVWERAELECFTVCFPEQKNKWSSPQWSRGLSHQNIIVCSFSPLYHHQLLNFTIYSKTRILTYKTKERREDTPGTLAT